MMILHLMLFLAVSRMAQADGFKECPEKSACLYHASCPDPSKPDAENNLATYFPSEFNRWSVEHCRFFSPNKTELIIRPFSDHKWEFTLRYTLERVEITFGDSLLTINAKDDAALFKSTTSAKPKELFFKRDLKSVSFTLESDKKLLDLFHDSKLSYADDGAPAGHWKEEDEKHLWFRTKALITGCDYTLITDDCFLPTKMHCTPLFITNHNATCPGEEKIWLKDENSKWLGLRSIDCQYDKHDWSLKNENDDNVPAPKGSFTIRCATEQPAPTPNGLPDSTTAEPSTTTNDAKEIYPTFIVPFLVYLARL